MYPSLLILCDDDAHAEFEATGPRSGETAW
jgi:hypothetical protein